MAINRSELVTKLELVAPAANPGSFVSEFQNIHFNKNTLFASDGIVSIYTDNPLPEYSFSIKSDTFLNLLRNISAEEVSINIKEENLAVKTKKIEGKFKIGKSSIPTITDRGKGSFSIKNVELLEALRLCRFGVCKEKTSGVISGVRIEGNKVYSTDRIKAYRYDLGISAGLEPFTLPTKFIEIILRNKENIEIYGFSENKFFVILKDGSSMETSVYTGKFPPVEEYFSELGCSDVDKSGFLELNFEAKLETVLEKHLRSLLDSTDFFDREIKFSVSGRTCTLFSESKNSGNLVEEVALDADLGTFEFIVNPTLLQEVLWQSKGKFMYQFMYQPEKQLILISADRLQVLIQTKA